MQILSLCWAQLQEQGPAEERTTTLTPVPTYSSAFSAVRSGVRSESYDCLLQLQFQHAVAHNFLLYFYTNCRVEAYACSCMCMRMHAYDLHFSLISFNYIHRHFSLASTKQGWHMLILEFKRPQALFCSYLPSWSWIWIFPQNIEIMWAVFFFLIVEMIRVMWYCDKVDREICRCIHTSAKNLSLDCTPVLINVQETVESVW